MKGKGGHRHRPVGYSLTAAPAGPEPSAHSTYTYSRIEPHRQAGTRHVVLGLADRVLAEMEDGSGEHRRRMAVADALDQVIERAHPARGNHRHRNAVGD